MSVSIRMRGRRVAAAGVLAALATLALCAGPGAAAGRASVWVSSVSITGTPTSGELLTGHATWGGQPRPEVAFRWVRCAGPSTDDCSFIPGAEAQTYRLTDADVARQLFLVVFASNRSGSAWRISNRTATIAARPKPTPSPTPDPTPDPVTPTPPSTGSGTGTGRDIVPPDTTTPSTPAGGVRGAETALRWLAPFPVVRIRGWLTPAGAKVTLLTVRAPRGARIQVRCFGRHCPRRRYAQATRLVRLKPYQRLLRGSMRLEISITRRGFVGKRTVIVLRRGKAPSRRDLCLYPGIRKAKACRAA